MPADRNVSGKEVKIQVFSYRGTTNVEPEMYGYTGYNWSHWNSDDKLKEKSVSYTGKTFDRFTTADSCTENGTHNTESAAVWNWSVGGEGVQLGQGECREEKTCDNRQQQQQQQQETLGQYPNEISGKHEIKELYKQPYWAIHSLQDVLM
jgi:hypothetical protein